MTNPITRKYPTRYWHELVLCASALSMIYSPIAYTVESNELIAAQIAGTAVSEETYTINFNNISIIELIRFTSKISGLNFIFEEADLQFSVTVVSEEAISIKSVLSVLAQALRMRNLNLVEQNGNVLITSSKKINQIPRIVSADDPKEEQVAALVTRVFRVNNGSVNAVAAIIRPLISDSALLEVLVDSKQLIITDIPANVDQINTLLTLIDTPQSSLEIDSYQVKNIAPVELTTLAKELLQPFLEGNPFLLVPQVPTNSIFIVSSPYLIEKALTILEDLDTPPSAQETLQSKVKSSFFVYHPKYRPGDELETQLQHLATNFTDSGLADPGFLETLASMRWNPSTNSLVFTGSPTSLQKIQNLLDTIDVKEGISASAKGVFLYKLKYVSCEKVLKELQELAEKIPTDTPQNQHLVAAIDTLECVSTNNSLLISGTTGAIEQIKAMIVEFDTSAFASSSAGISLFLYHPKYLSAEDVQASLLTIAESTKNTGMRDPQLIQTISSAHVIVATNSLIFTGSQETLQRLQDLLAAIDTAAAAGQNDQIEEINNVTFLLYKTQYIAPEALAGHLKEFSLQLNQTNISSKELITSIDTVKIIPDKHSLLFTGTKKTLTQLEPLLQKFDNAAQEGVNVPARTASNYVLYSPRYLSGSELITILQEFMQTLVQSGVTDPSLFDSINNLQWMDKTSSLVISGTPTAIEQVQQLLTRFDSPEETKEAASIESIDNTSFLVYKLQYHPGNDIQSALKQIAVSLITKGTTTPSDLSHAINSVQWIQVTNSLLCTGPQDVLVRLKDLIQNLDIPLRQVFIEVLVIETTLNNQQNFGLMWGGQVKYLNKTILNTGNFPVSNSAGSLIPQPSPGFPSALQNISSTVTPTGTSIPFTTGFDLGVIGDIIMHKGKSFLSLGSLLNALQQDADSTIVLNPKIITQDNRQSTIFVGQNVPYTGAIVTNSSNSTVSTSNIEYRDVGVNLTITPILGDGDVVTMDISQDISELVNSANNGSTSTTVLTGIQTTHTHMETRVHVPNNHFVALSGMINDTKTHFKTGIPCLGGLPVIGALFSETDRGATKNNIIVFVRPQIITSYQEYKAITEHQEWLYKDNARIPVLKEEFDEAIDLVKRPEDE